MQIVSVDIGSTWTKAALFARAVSYTQIPTRGFVMSVSLL